MKLTLVGVVALAVCCSSFVLSGQAPPPARHLVGYRFGGNWHLDPATKSTIETATLTFEDGDGRSALTVDFAARYATGSPRRAPSVVDMIVTEVAPEDDRPAMQMRVDDEPLSLIGRLRSRRSIVATMSFDDFIRLTRAGRIVEHAFGAELEFGQGQMRMLRSTAEKWSGR